MDDDLNQLRVFVEVAREGGVSAAARSLGMPTSTVSRRVQELERRLGVRLLQRTTRSVRLTELGEGYYRRAVRVVEEFEDTQAWIRSRAEVPTGTLRVTTFQLLAATLLGPVLVDYLEENPGMSAQVLVSERDLDLVDERIDVAIRIGSLPDSSLVVRKLAVMDGWMLATPEYLARRGSPSHPRELADHDCLVYKHDTEPLTVPFSDGAVRVEAQLPSRCAANSVGLVRQATLGGLGIGFLPPMLVHDDLAAGRFVRVLVDWTTASLPIYAVYPSRRHLAKKVRSFVDLLVARVTTASVNGAS